MKPSRFTNILRLFLLIMAVLLPISVSTAQDDEDTFTDADGLYTVPVPTNWTVEETAEYVLLQAPEASISVYILALEIEDPREAIAAAWDVVDPTFDVEPIQTIDIPEAQLGDYDAGVLYNYDMGMERFIQAAAQGLDDVMYVFIFDGSITALQQRTAQVQTIATGFLPTALVQDDLSTSEALPLSEEMIAELEPFIESMMEFGEIPGLSIAIVQNGEVIYRNGFGVLALGEETPVTPETMMMIGSITKTMTTLAMQSLVEDDLLDWDTPVVEILPGFQVADAAITQTLTVQNLVCACTGVPRRDYELLFNANDLSAEDIIESLSTFQFFTDFGETFQYSNQMVATGGYVAAVAAGGEYGALHDAYVTMMQERIFDPMGMTSSTFDFDTATSRESVAQPHGQHLVEGYVQIPFDYEALLIPVTPAGGVWSNVDDMARYLLTLLNGGTTPDGTQIASQEGLEYLWQPQVQITAQLDYGLGWMIENYKGVRVLSHGGNMLGYTADMAFVPGADLGVVTLANAQYANATNEAIRARVLELVYAQEPEIEALMRSFYGADEGDDSAEATAEATEEADVSEEAPGDFAESVEVDLVTPFIGTWESAELGTITLALDENNVLTIDAGEFISEILPILDEEGEIDTYVMVSPPLASLPLYFNTDENGDPSFVIGTGLIEYTFTMLSE